MTNKKNKFFTFCCSLIPGAGEMYLGFYKMGLSLMILFGLLTAVAGFFNLPASLFLLPAIWFYSFFHVHNLNSLPDEEFYALEDDWLFNIGSDELTVDKLLHKYRKALAYLLIFFGISIIWNLFYSLLIRILRMFYISDEFFSLIRNISYSIPQTVAGIIIIYIGVQLIKGKKEDLDQEHDPIIPSPPYVEYKEIKETEEDNSAS